MARLAALGGPQNKAMSQGQPQASSRFVVITGLSGSGKSTALRALEDVGFYAVDNLPVELMPAFVNLPVKQMGPGFKAALGMDVRASGFVEKFPEIYHDLLSQGFNLELVFLDASDNALIRRYSQTRRQHPLDNEYGDVGMGIRLEREMLEPLRGLASHVLDTSRFNVHQLRQEIINLYTRLAPPAKLQLNLISFGFKYGLPLEADLVMDVRFLANPYFEQDLRPLDGRDHRVVNYVFQHESTGIFLKRFKELLDFLIPQYRREGKTRLTIAIGCTGGKHRSVAISEWLAKHLEGEDRRISLRHRDIELG